ncbi:MAG TPA: hypothetical protein VF158_02990 [Longimicrobiales bacterium]
MAVRRAVAVEPGGLGPASADREAWLRAALSLDDWMRARDYAGYDPHDLLASPLVRALCFGSRWLAVAWTQLGKRSRVQLRPLLGVRPARNAKGIGLVVAAHVRLYEATADARHRETARRLVDWLRGAATTGADGAGWGYPFPWANRDFYAPAGTPSSVVTAFVGHALLDAADAFGWDDARDLAHRGAAFVQRALNRIPGPDGTFCFSYTPLDRRGVHNASLLAASLLARVAALHGDAGLADDALRAARFSARAQRPDGSWPYGLGARNAWVDSFHTGYVLVALRDIGAALGTDEFDAVVDAGLAYWRSAFLGGPAVGFHAGAPYPIDAHAVAHAMLMLLALREREPEALATARRLAGWSVREMRDARGYFYYVRRRRGVNRLPYMRWVQAWMLRALSEMAVADGAAMPTGKGEG